MGWISVNDNLPNVGDAVLTCDPQGYVQILHYLNGYDWFVSDGKTFETNRQSLPVGFYENTTKPFCETGYEVNTDITYWMPLPEPPSPAY